jgi:hypothetical protein
VIPKEWLEIAQLVSSIAAACGLALTACGLGLTAWQMHRNRQTADLQVQQKFFEIADKHEYDLAHSKDEAWKFAFNEFLNFLEVHCNAYNRAQFGSGCRDMVRHKLEDCYIELDKSPQCHPLIAKALDRSTTLIEFRKFVKSNKREIERRAAERASFVEADSIN